MKSEKSLKEENQKVVTSFIVWCICLYLLSSVNASLSFDSIQTKLQEISAKDSLVIILMPILILVLSGLIPSWMKEILVFWRVKHPLPGCRAFTKLAPRDDRIDMNNLCKKLGTLPTDPKEQNAIWYKLLKSYSNSVTVEKAHKYFLLSRDMSSIALLFAIPGSIGLMIQESSSLTVLKYSLFMTLQYVLLALVARHHGNRLVCNVLALFTAE